MRTLLSRLKRDASGVAAIEFAFTAPLVLGLFMSGAEITNYQISKMRINQIALHVADNASRIGTQSLLTNPQISEKQINDLLIGANLQAGNLQFQQRGRIILSSLEPMANPNTSNTYKIHWQRCYGAKVWPSSYGDQGATNLTAMGPAGRQATAPEGGAVMYVEVAYDYRPLVSSRLAPQTLIRDVAAMVVRDDRDYNGGPNGSGVHNNEAVTASTCV